MNNMLGTLDYSIGHALFNLLLFFKVLLCCLYVVVGAVFGAVVVFHWCCCSSCVRKTRKTHILHRIWVVACLVNSHTSY